MGIVSYCLLLGVVRPGDCKTCKNILQTLLTAQVRLIGAPMALLKPPVTIVLIDKRVHASAVAVRVAACSFTPAVSG
jgi:hypothetical protein